MPQCYLEKRIKQIYLGEDIKRAYIGSQLFFSRSQKVTYYIDVKNNIKEEVELDYGTDAVAYYTPEVPSHWGNTWSFVGWRDDIKAPVADENVLNKKIVETEEITLYAVFKQTVTQTFVGSSSNPITKDIYWNASGTYYYPEIKFPSPTNLGNGWKIRGWSASGVTTGNAQPLSNGSLTPTLTVTGNNTFYALYERNTVISYYNNGGTGSMANKNMTIRYSASGKFGDNALTLPSCEFAKRSHTSKTWALNGVAGKQYSTGDTYYVEWDTTFYAIWTYNTVTHVLNNNPAWSQLAAYDDVQLQSSHWKVDYQGCITFGTSIDVSKITKISIRFNHSRDEDGKVKLSLYLPNVSGFTSDKERTNLVKTTDWILAPSGNSTTVDFDVSTLTGNRYISIYIDDVTNSGHATCSLYGVSYV